MQLVNRRAEGAKARSNRHRDPKRGRSRFKGKQAVGAARRLHTDLRRAIPPRSPRSRYRRYPRAANCLPGPLTVRRRAVIPPFYTSSAGARGGPRDKARGRVKVSRMRNEARAAGRDAPAGRAIDAARFRLPGHYRPPPPPAWACPGSPPRSIDPPSARPLSPRCREIRGRELAATRVPFSSRVIRGRGFPRCGGRGRVSRDRERNYNSLNANGGSAPRNGGRRTRGTLLVNTY